MTTKTMMFHVTINSNLKNLKIFNIKYLHNSLQVVPYMDYGKFKVSFFIHLMKTKMMKMMTKMMKMPKMMI